MAVRGSSTRARTSHGTGVRGHSVTTGGVSDGYGSSDTDTDTAFVLFLPCSQFPFS